MDDESGESMELMKEVPLAELGESSIRCRHFISGIQKLTKTLVD